MSSPMSMRLGLIGGLVALIMAFTASSAFAKITLTPGGPYNASQTLEKVEITEAPAEATRASIAECNISGLPATWGQRCNLASAAGPSTLTGGAKTFVNVPILRVFEDTDFTVQPPVTGETETTCKNEAGVGDQCAIVASYYRPKTGGGFEHFASEKVNILFK